MSAVPGSDDNAEAATAGGTDGPPVAPGPLVVSGGGSTMVATDALLAQAAMLRLLHGEAAEWQARLVRIRALEFDRAPTWTAGSRAADIYGAAQAVDTVEAHSGTLADALMTAAEGYGDAERLAELLGRYSGAGAAYLLGRLLPVLAALAVPLLTGGALAWLLGSAVSGTSPADAPGRLAEALRRNPRLLTNPVLVHAVRVLVSSVDDGAAGLAGVPFAVSFPFGDEGIGLFGVGTSAAGVLGIARPFGLLRESAVTVGPGAGSPARALPPAGLADLAARIPPASRDGPQVRIERYGTSTSTRPAWVVYVGGTVQWNPRTTGEPWDFTSNVAAIADADNGAGSFRAVVQAMQEAGVHPEDPVVQVGHSQGGLIAAQVAASAEFNTVAVASFGAPNGQVPVPDAVPMIRVEHSDDLVPALGGTSRDTTTPGSEHLVVRREVYATGAVPADQPVPAHSMTNYRDTARLIDGSTEPRLVEFRARIGGVLGSEPGDVTMWRATRVPAG